MKRKSLIAAVTVGGLGLVVVWALRRDRPEHFGPREGIEVSARAKSGASRSPLPTEADSLVPDEPSDLEPGVVPPPESRHAAVPPLPRTIKLGGGAEPPLPPGPTADPAWGAPAEAGAGDGASDAPADLTPVTLLENQRTAFRQYALKFGGNPVGDNAEITAALRGQNARQSVFLTTSDGLRVNGEGQAVDAWSTPYFFHQLSRTEMEIRSAGPDRRMWTTDDLVLK